MLPTSSRSLVLLCLASVALLGVGRCRPPVPADRPDASFVAFESGPVRPLALSPGGGTLYAVNTPDNQLEIFRVGSGGIAHAASVPVGLEPVAVAVHGHRYVWVVNHLSDSVSIVDLSSRTPRVVRTLLVGDEPRDLVFAGPSDPGVHHHRPPRTTTNRCQRSPPFPARAILELHDRRASGGPTSGSSTPTSLGGGRWAAYPVAILTFFADRPRALAVSPAGDNGLRGGVHSSGNQTALTIGLICPTSASCEQRLPARAPHARTPAFRSPGGVPGTRRPHHAAPAPETGLIVKPGPRTDRAPPGEDELGRDWSATIVRFDLPDRDVFAIDAEPRCRRAWPTAVDLSTAVAWARSCSTWSRIRSAVGSTSPTRRRSERSAASRGAGPTSTRSAAKPCRARLSTVAGSPARGAEHRDRRRRRRLPQHLNQHIDYSELFTDANPANHPDPAKINQSLATPLQTWWSPVGRQHDLHGGLRLFESRRALDASDIEDAQLRSELRSRRRERQLHGRERRRPGRPGRSTRAGAIASTSLTRFDNGVSKSWTWASSSVIRHAAATRRGTGRSLDRWPPVPV